MRASTAVLVASGMVVAGILVWGIDRGFDVADEAFYLIESAQPSRPAFTHFGHIIHALFLGNAPTIIESRVARFVLMFAASVVFGLGVHAWSRATFPAAASERFHRIDAIAVAWLGSALAWAFLPQSLSYNTLIAVSLMVAAASVLRWIARDPSERGRPAASADLVLAGASTAAAFFVKAPSGALLGLLVGSSVLAASTWKAASSALLRVGVGFAIVVVVFFAAVCPPDVWLGDVRFAAGAGKEVDHGVKRLITVAVENLSVVGRCVLQRYGVFIALTAALVAAWRRIPRLVRSPWAGPAMVVLGAAAFAATLAASQGYSAAWLVSSLALCAYLVLALAVAICAYAGAGDGERSPDASPAARRTQRRIGWAILVALPPIGVVGSNVSPSQLVLEVVTPWIVAIALLAAWASHRSGRWIYGLSTTAIAALVPCHVVTGFVMSQGTLLESTLLEQSVPVEGLERLRGIRLDPARAEFFERVAAALHVNSPGERPPGVVALHDMPGVVWAVGQGPLRIAELLAKLPTRTRRLLADVPDSDLRSYWILLSTRRAGPGPQILRERGLAFPDGYTRIASFPNPFQGEQLEVWRPNAR
jgi:hypothetical protein